jgi:hypothetical protein
LVILRAKFYKYAAPTALQNLADNDAKRARLKATMKFAAKP